MRKTILLLILFFSISTPTAFAHPYINSTSINDVNGPIPGIKITGLGNSQNFPDSEIEFLSDQWVVQNFLWLLLGVIAVFVGIFTILVYHEDLPTVKIQT